MRTVISHLSQKPLKILCVFILIVVFSTTVFVGMSFSKQIYRWVDENGVVHFSNCPDSLPISNDCKVGTMWGSDYVLPPLTKEHIRDERGLAIQKAIQDVIRRLNDVQAKIDTVISLKGHSLSDIHTERGVVNHVTQSGTRMKLLHEIHEIELKKREERIKANTEQSLERLKSKKEILINRLLELQRKLEN